VVAIARAPTLSPAILLLNEPFEGLAPVVVSRFIDATRRIKDKGVSLLLAESTLATASRIAIRLYTIVRGEIIPRGGRPLRPVAQPTLRSLVLAVLAVTPLVAQAQDTSPLTADEEASLQQIRDFVQATAERYRMLAALEVSVASWVGNPSLPQYASSPAVKTGGQLFLNRRLLGASNRDLVIATALAYEMLRGSGQATSLAGRQRERAQLVLDGNARAIDILVQVKGMSEQAALEAMYGWLLGMHRAALASGRPPEPGGVPPCDAIGDLLRRYPGSREWFAGRECAPP